MATTEEASSGLATAKVILSATASFTATLLLARSMMRDLLPEDIQENFAWGVRKLFKRYLSPKLTIVIEEFEGLEPNKLYEAAGDYLVTKISPSTTRIRVSRHEKEAWQKVSVEPEQEITDVFDGVNIKWEFVLRTVQSNQPSMGRRYEFGTSETRYFELTFDGKHKDMIVNRYLPYVEERATEVRQEKKTLKLFTLSMDFYNLSDIWTPVNLDHPSTFDTLAMDSKLKETVLEDLERFVRRKEYYRRVGKAWKRGYLLFGPPGTGKSSLIAAMANYLKFDVYDLELTGVSENWELRKALVATANRSILVVEDIDCTIDFSDRSATKEETTMPGEPQQKKITLSALLNFIDGLWSSCGDERIIIFTTNHKDKLDPALLRPGRMDMHVHMSYCTPSGFRLLASNYLGVKHHVLFGMIEDLIGATEVTPAEVAEELMKSDDPEKAFRDVIEFLRAKKEEKRKKENEEEKVTKEEGSEKRSDEATEENKNRSI